MKKFAFLFPGQGSQCVGMGREFYQAHLRARDIMDEAVDVLGYDIRKIAFEGPQEVLNLTENTQPALLMVSVAILEVMRESMDVEPVFLAGHSLGEYTALVAGGAMDYRSALRMVHLRGRYMQEAVSEGTGMMCAVVGLGLGVIEDVCREVSREGSVVVPANLNTPEQTVISGHRDAVQRAMGVLKERGARRLVPLHVSVPSHSPLMEPASRRLRKDLEGIEFSPLRIPVVTNVSARPLEDTDQIPDTLARQLISPVRWVDTIRWMKDNGVDCMVEIGSGRVLTGLVRRIEKELETINVSTPSDLREVIF